MLAAADRARPYVTVAETRRTQVWDLLSEKRTRRPTSLRDPFSTCERFPLLAKPRAESLRFNAPLALGVGSSVVVSVVDPRRIGSMSFVFAHIGGWDSAEFVRTLYAAPGMPVRASVAVRLAARTDAMHMYAVLPDGGASARAVLWLRRFSAAPPSQPIARAETSALSTLPDTNSVTRSFDLVFAFDAFAAAPKDAPGSAAPPNEELAQMRIFKAEMKKQHRRILRAHRERLLSEEKLEAALRKDAEATHLVNSFFRLHPGTDRHGSRRQLPLAVVGAMKQLKTSAAEATALRAHIDALAKKISEYERILETLLQTYRANPAMDMLREFVEAQAAAHQTELQVESLRHRRAISGAYIMELNKRLDVSHRALTHTFQHLLALSRVCSECPSCAVPARRSLNLAIAEAQRGGVAMRTEGPSRELRVCAAYDTPGSEFPYDPPTPRSNPRQARRLRVTVGKSRLPVINRCGHASGTSRLQVSKQPLHPPPIGGQASALVQSFDATRASLASARDFADLVTSRTIRTRTGDGESALGNDADVGGLSEVYELGIDDCRVELESLFHTRNQRAVTFASEDASDNSLHDEQGPDISPRPISSLRGIRATAPAQVAARVLTAEHGKIARPHTEGSKGAPRFRQRYSAAEPPPRQPLTHAQKRAARTSKFTPNFDYLKKITSPSTFDQIVRYVSSNKAPDPNTFPSLRGDARSKSRPDAPFRL